MKRKDIHIISRHSNWSAGAVARALRDHVYNDTQSWQKFLRLFVITLAIGFTTSGIVFFFAYNWADLHKFIKLGLIEGLIVIAIMVMLLVKIDLTLKNILLTGASILVGVLFAVFGQIYQTGANAYDFFLGWTVFVTLWVLISNFPPLWLIYLTLINTTLILYAQQVAFDWSGLFIFTSLFLINTGILIIFIWSKAKNFINAPEWLINTLALASITYSTMGVITSIFEPFESSFIILVIATAAYGCGIKYGFQTKRVFYLSIIPFSIIIIISALLIKISDGAGMFFTVSIFVISSITLVIKALIDIQKKWING